MALAFALLDGAEEGVGGSLSRHPEIVRLLLLAGIFAFGYYEATVFQHRASACTAWLFCLAVITAWIASPLTALRIVVATLVFLAGALLLVRFYRSHGRLG